MTTTLRSKIQAELAWTWTDHIDTLPIVDGNRLRASVDMPDGNSAGQADAVWHASDQSLSTGQSVVYELDQLYQDLFGSFIEIPLGASGDQIAVPAGSPLLLANTQDGWLIPSGQTDLKIQAVEGPITYDIAILGTLSTQQPSSSSS